MVSLIILPFHLLLVNLFDLKNENSISSPPLIVNNTFIMSKENKKLHELGIESVISTVKKYDGDFV